MSEHRDVGLEEPALDRVMRLLEGAKEDELLQLISQIAYEYIVRYEGDPQRASDISSATDNGVDEALRMREWEGSDGRNVPSRRMTLLAHPPRGDEPESA
jgi:hypothetical protein